MTIANTNIAAKVAAVIALAAMVLWTFAPAAKADTTSDLQAQIASLLAQIQTLQAQLGTASGTQGTAVQFNTNLTVGSKGADVTALQQFLVAQKFLQMPAGAAYGYFGAVTKAALASYQAANGISPAVGYFGPITRAKVNAATATTGTGTNTGGTTSTGTTLSGGAGTLLNFQTLGDINTALNEGDTNQNVVGISADASGSDIQLQRVDVTFDLSSSTNTGSTNLNRYIQSASLVLDGKVLATMNASDADKNGKVWTMRFVNLNGVIKKGNTGDLYVQVDAVSSLNSADTSNSITASITANGISAVDAQGLSVTYDSTAYSQAFSVSTASTGTLTISTDSSNPVNSVIKVDTANTTDSVTALAFTLKAKNQDVTVTDLPIGFVTSDNSVSDVVSTVKLMKGSTVLGSKTPGTGTHSEVVFTNVNQTISDGSTQTYTVVVNLKKETAYADAATLYATSSNDAQWDVSDANGTNVTPSSSATGGTLTLQTTGVSVALDSASTNTSVGTLSGEGDSTQYTINFSVTAGDSDLYISRAAPTRLANTSTTPSGNNTGVNWATTTTSTAAAQAMLNPAIASTFSSAGYGPGTGGDAAGYYKVNAGTTRSFTFSATITATTTGYTGVELVGIGYSTTTTFLGDYYTASLDSFKTNDVSMRVH